MGHGSVFLCQRESLTNFDSLERKEINVGDAGRCEATPSLQSWFVLTNRLGWLNCLAIEFTTRPGCLPQAKPRKAASRPRSRAFASQLRYGASSWAMLDLNQRLLPCEGSTLPLS